MFKRYAKRCSAIGVFLVVATLLVGVIQAGSAAVNYTITRVSVSSSGEQANNDSRYADVSDDGRFVAFYSCASNLVQASSIYCDVYVHDRQTGQTTIVSQPPAGGQSNQYSSHPSISGDGRFVAFESEASNLVQSDTNGKSDIFVHDRQTGQTTRVSVASSGVQGNENSYRPNISSDGQYIVFDSEASNLVQGDTNAQSDIFVHDRQTGQTTRVSVTSSGEQSNQFSIYPTISDNGQYVAFYSGATNLVQGDTNNETDVFVHDRQTGQTTRVSVTSSGQQGNKTSYNPSISSDGRFVAFESGASNLVQGDTNNETDVFVHDRQTGQTTRVSVTSSGKQVFDVSQGPSLSADGRFVTFQSKATNLVQDDYNSWGDIFIHDRQTGETSLVSKSGENQQRAAYGNFGARISANAKVVVFVSDITKLVEGDTNYKWDIFAYDADGVVTTGYTVSGVVTKPGGTPVQGVQVSINGNQYTTDAQGKYTATGLVTGTYTVSVTSDTAVFTPAVQTVTVPPNSTAVNFEQVCISPYTGLNVCELQPGDILLYSHNADRDAILVKNLVGTYWYHAALYKGDYSVVHANEKAQDPQRDVLVQPIKNTFFWVGLGNERFDWTVLRPKATNTQKQGAVSYATEKANDPTVTYVRSSVNAYFDKGTDNEFTCSEFVWKAYEQTGFPMEIDVSLWRWAYPQYNFVVTADDIYFSQYLGMSETVQQKEPSTSDTIERVVFYLLSPADLLLTDSQGRRVGSNPILGQQYAEVPNAQHYSQPEMPEVIILQAEGDETWQLQTIGTGEGSYRVQAVNFGTTNLITQTATMTTTVGKVDTFAVTLEAGNTVPIKLTHESTTLPDENRYIFLPLVTR